MIADLAIQISKVIEEYYPHDDYFALNINLMEGVIRFNNTDWEHAIGKLNKTLIRKGGEWE